MFNKLTSDQIFTIITIIISSTIGFLASYFTIRLQKKKDIELKKLEWKKNHQDNEVIDPIKKYIDKMLASVSLIYWNKINEVKSKNLKSNLNYFQENHSSIISRLYSIEVDSELIKDFRKFSFSYYEMFQEINKGINKAYEKMQKVEKLAGQILEKIYNLN